MPIKLTLTAEQAQIVATACEFYARIKIGQFQEIIWHVLDVKLPTDDFCKRRDLAEHYLLEARKYIYPELHGVGHSYGLGKFEEADKAFDVYQVIRPHFGDPRSPFSPFPLPVCEKKETERNGEKEIEITLTLPEEQAKIVSDACEFFARIKAGHFKRVASLTLDKVLPTEECYEYHNKAKHFLLEARKCIYPELADVEHSYSVRKFEDASKAYDIHQAIDCCFGNPRVHFGSYPLPICEKIEEK